MVSIAICDDEQVHIDILRGHIVAILDHLGEEYRILSFTSANRLVEALGEYNVLFLDLRLENDMDGMEVARELREKGYAQILIFVTSLQNRSNEGYRVKALRYLPKPLRKEEVAEAVMASLKELKSSPNKLTIRFKGSTFYIPTENIFTIESYYGKRKVYTTDGIYETNQAWEDLMVQLPAHQFARVNRSYRVNLAMVKSIGVTDVTMDSGQTVKFGRGMKKEFEIAFHLFAGGMKLDRQNAGL